MCNFLGLIKITVEHNVIAQTPRLNSPNLNLISASFYVTMGILFKISDLECPHM